MNPFQHDTPRSKLKQSNNDLCGSPEHQYHFTRESLFKKSYGTTNGHEYTLIVRLFVCICVHSWFKSS